MGSEIRFVLTNAHVCLKKHLLMNRSTDPHPEAQSLADYAAGLDVSVSREMLEAHLETCDECTATLARADQPTILTQRIGDALRASQNKPNGTSRSLPLVLKRLEPSTYPKSLGRLAQYELLEVVGQGAFGIVFRAFDQSLARIVAIKVLSLDFPEGSVAQLRFLREARAAARIQHENVVRILAVAEVPMPYIVMEYVDGESLQSPLDRSIHCTPHEIRDMGCQIAEGLAAAHACGLIHRDVKPDNILILTTKPSSSSMVGARAIEFCRQRFQR